ncbi:hypothetical protein ACHAXT_007190 [Thalassiosira profunda]
MMCTIIEFSCNNCDKKGTPIDCNLPPGYVKLFTCGKCKETLYCSKQCQSTDWNKGEFLGHKGACARFAKETKALHATGDRTIHERFVAAAKSGFSHALMKMPAHGHAKNQLIEGENWVNTMIGVAYEEEEYFKANEDHAGVCLLVDGPHCAVMLKSKRTKVKLVRAGLSEEEGDVLPRLQLKLLTSGDKILVTLPPTNDPLLQLSGYNQNITLGYTRERTAGNASTSTA